MERRLAAILAADFVGYSPLIEANEVGTLTVLKARRKTAPARDSSPLMGWSGRAPAPVSK
jgi:hypothetical protein